ncbi:hypothetical protein JKP88DRAFT_178244, partial [Tribonema minus]
LPWSVALPSATDNETVIIGTYDYNRSAVNVVEGDQARFTFTHTSVTPEAQRLRLSVAALQGRKRTHFAGAWTSGLGHHEDAVRSGIEAANRIMAGAGAYPVLERAVPLHQPFAPSSAPAANAATAAAAAAALFEPQPQNVVTF